MSTLVVIEPITLHRIQAAAKRLAEHAVVTPIIDGGDLVLKAENRQRAGAFKFRGAFNRLSRIPEPERSLGVVAVSSGNHGAAVSVAANILGIHATIFTPEDAPEVKRRLIEANGGTVSTFPRSIADREGPARDFAAENGATFVHPFEDPEIMAGQGTTALELHHQAGHLDALFIPIGGGGLMAGCASAMHVLDPSCRMVGVEPENADDTWRSFEAGHPVAVPNPQTIADGLAVPRPGDNTLSINLDLVSEIVIVTEEEIVDAMRMLYNLFDEVVEPSGAVSYAGLLKVSPSGRSGAILSGGNVDKARFPEVFSR